MYYEPFTSDGKTYQRWVWEAGDRADYVGVHGARYACEVLSVDGQKTRVKITSTRNRVYRRGEIIDTSTNWIVPRKGSA